jgi:two-component system sensor histidine kinase QseC
MMTHFDEALETKAHAFAEMIEQEPEGIIIEMRKEFLPEYSRQYNAEYYQVWTQSGDVISRSPSLRNMDLPKRTGELKSPVFWNLILPDGRPGRAIGVSFFPFLDDENQSVIKRRQKVQVVLARNRIEISSMLRVLLLGTAVFITIIVIGILTMVPRVIKSGLSPLKRLAYHTTTIDSKSLGSRYDTDDLPYELRPIAKRLNELLERIESAFVREKRLTADIAHELKTPIAELRSLAEVALKWPDDYEFTNNALREASDISVQMDRTVSVLLALGRCESGKQNISPASVDVKSLLTEVLSPWEKMANDRDIRINCNFPDIAEVVTDPILFTSVLTNICSNAVEHCPEGGHVECTLKNSLHNLRFSITNSNVSLAAEDIPHIFDYLWRKDSARSDSSHSGLGLTLVNAFAGILDIEIKAELLQSGDFSMTLFIPYSLRI